MLNEDRGVRPDPARPGEVHRLRGAWTQGPDATDTAIQRLRRFRAAWALMEARQEAAEPVISVWAGDEPPQLTYQDALTADFEVLTAAAESWRNGPPSGHRIARALEAGHRALTEAQTALLALVRETEGGEVLIDDEGRAHYRWREDDVARLAVNSGYPSVIAEVERRWTLAVERAVGVVRRADEDLSDALRDLPARRPQPEPEGGFGAFFW
ncbi:hypothetical protein SRB5_54270 [Streptomyces sp. RB5]|uniref:Uncharacterized protein n=1 Tax=Streptomyces smaragdinus TaxID=2585196 RepID=A0A7K0CP38_9ACTN|nr:hypothetical protein [Streptomyces smaragdinus]MQY15248.1 hypothetical protein [Streptomyces smaragdinus]